MDRTYILHRIYTSENSAEHRDTQLSEMYPDVAGTKEAIEKELNRRIEYAKAKGFTVEEISSEDVHKGHYFDRVVKMQQLQSMEFHLFGQFINIICSYGY